MALMHYYSQFKLGIPVPNLDEGYDQSIVKIPPIPEPLIPDKFSWLAY